MVLEEPAAEVAENRCVHGPRCRGERIEGDEPRVRVVRHTAGERGSRAASRHIPADDQDETTAVVELATRPAKRALSAVALKEAFLERPSDEASEAVGDRVAAEGSERSGDDHPAKRELADDRQQPRGDQCSLAGQDWHDRVAEGQRPDDEVRLRWM